MTPDQKIARLKETATRKVAESKKKQAEPDRQLKLELWPDEVRGKPTQVRLSSGPDGDRLLLDAIKP